MLGRLPPAEVSLRELSRQVGLAKSNVVRYFPTREAVFSRSSRGLDSWRRPWRPHCPCGRAPAAARTSRTRGVRHRGDAEQHPRFCDLLVACQTVLEHNVPVETARAFKAAALSRLNRLAGLVRSQLPELGDAESFSSPACLGVRGRGVPMAHPAPVMATVLAEPQFAPLRVDFTTATRRMLTVVLDGLMTATE